jgi:hypothetical protein
MLDLRAREERFCWLFDDAGLNVQYGLKVWLGMAF